MTARDLFIGDVHGCADELERLLHVLQPTGDDRLHFTGDVLARGPDSRRVLRLLREHRAVVVRGNHEARLLVAREAQRQRVMGPWLSASHVQLLRSMTDEEWAQLEAMPLYHWVRPGELLVVHAGLVPGVALDAQKEEDLTKMRTLLRTGSASSKLVGRLWGESYVGPHVVFGHNAVTGLQLHPHATGLDTGCVYGHRLTALAIPRGAPVPPPAERAHCLFSVPAAHRYFSTEHE